jgi:2,3-dihydroxybenzoate decarboxylase
MKFFLNQHDLVNTGRNNVLKVLTRLSEEPHNLKSMTPVKYQVVGLRLRDGKVTYGMYKEDWSRKLAKQ